jgi:hypothetical protein
MMKFKIRVRAGIGGTLGWFFELVTYASLNLVLNRLQNHTNNEEKIRTS